MFQENAQGIPLGIDDAAILDAGFDVREAIVQLANPYRLVIILRYHAGLSQKEVAQALDIPFGTAGVQLMRGRALLEPLLRSYAPVSRPLSEGTSPGHHGSNAQTLSSGGA